MVARPEEVVQNLYSNDAATRLKAIREVKNQIIGNKTKKLSYVKLGVVPRVVELLASEGEHDDAAIKVQSATAVGSFAYGVPDGLRAVVDSGGVASLLQALHSEQEKVVEASVRSLKMIYQSNAPQQGNIAMLDAAAVQRLTSLVASPNRAIAEGATVLLASIARDAPTMGDQLATTGVLPSLTTLLGSQQDRACQEAAADALAQCVATSSAAVQMVSKDEATMTALMGLLKSPRPRLRFFVCKCLTHIVIASRPPASNTSGVDASSSSTAATPPQEQELTILPILVKLLDETTLQEDVPTTLATLATGSPALQQAATDADAVTKLARFVLNDTNKYREGALQAIGTLCMPGDREDGRKQLIEAKLLSPITRALQDPCPSIRAAACGCLRALTRSVKYLHTTIFDPDIAQQLLALLSDANIQVQIMASAALTNMVLHFAPVRAGLVKHKGVKPLVELVQSMDATLRLNGVWALQNLLYGPDPALRQMVLDHLPWEDTRALLHDDSAAVQEKTLCLLRNLLYDTHDIIHNVLQWAGGELMNVVYEKLDPQRTYPTPVRLQSLYILVNTAAGNDTQKDLIMDSPLPTLLTHYMRSSDKELRVAALWIVINLTYTAKDGSDQQRAASRVARLRGLHVETTALTLRTDEDLDVKERVKTVLDQMRGDWGGRGGRGAVGGAPAGDPDTALVQLGAPPQRRREQQQEEDEEEEELEEEDEDFD